MSHVQLTDLPVDPLLHILGYLDYRDLLSCYETCHHLRQLTCEDFLWRRLCRVRWMVKSCPADKSWRQHFIDWYEDFGQYIDCYKKIRKAWDQIETYTKKHCPNIYQSLKDGVSEAELEVVESKCHENLPLDLKCSYRIHNGQHLNSEHGLLGNMAISGHRSHSYKSEHLLDLQTSSEFYSDSGEMSGSLPITFCPRSRISQFLAISEDGGFLIGQMFYPCNSMVQYNNNMSTIDNFISAPSFSDWLIKYAQDLDDDIFPRYDGNIYRFYHEPSCVAMSGPIKVSVATSFIAEMSSVHKPEFFFTYHITMSMDENAPQRDACQLETREWTITDADGNEEHVEGPGVVGEFPLLKPGASFSYTSCTTFKTTYGNMRGIYRFRHCVKGEEVVVEVPCFHMKCLPYQTSADRRERRQHNKKNN